MSLRQQLSLVLSHEPPAADARDRILERGFFLVPGTPAPASVIELSASRPRL